MLVLQPRVCLYDPPSRSSHTVSRYFMASCYTLAAVLREYLLHLLRCPSVSDDSGLNFQLILAATISLFLSGHTGGKKVGVPY